jgi:hypothetical protein
MIQSQDQEEVAGRIATERSATRLGTSRRSRGVSRRFTRGESRGAVGWLTIGGNPPAPTSEAPAPAPTTAAGAIVAMLLRTAPGAAMG